jgi:uncharacterized protein (TIGR02145 family)
MKKLLFLFGACFLQFGLNAQTTTYLWSNGATTSTINVNPSVTTTYRVTITHGGMPYYDSLVVAVNPNPSAPTISTTAASCSSAGTATVTNYDASSTYTFSPTGPSVGAGGSINELTPATSYSVIVTNSNACLSPSSSSFSVAAQLPSNTASVASASPTICSNNALTNITHSTTGATGITNSGVSGANGLPAGVSVTWASNTITISGTPTTPGTYTYSIPLTGGCGTVNATGTITVTAPSTPTFTQVGPYLSGASIPALATTSTNGISGTWSPAISNTATTTYTFNPSAGQCGTTTTMTITINQPLQYTLTANDSTVCAGTTVTLSVNIQLPNTVTDIDGNVYQTVQIGNQIWMKENLRTTKYSNGDAIPYITDNSSWYGLSSGAYCWMNNDSQKDLSYGKLYNWYAAFDSRGLCPVGWRVPSDSDFATLINFLDNNSNPMVNGVESSIAGGYMKEIGELYWGQPNVNATNSSGFSARGAGSRGSWGFDNNFGEGTLWWTTNQGQSWEGISRWVQRNSGNSGRGFNTKQSGFSVRCLKD